MTIEIGTSDFRTMAGKVPGLFVEPVKYYFDRLPDCNKENVAVSNTEGWITVYYVTDEEIKEFNLPPWARGCNSVNRPHPTIVSLLKERGADPSRIRSDTVPVVRIRTLLDRHGITDIDLLKVDTEGYDTVILNDLLDTCAHRPKNIQFEANVLSVADDVTVLIHRLDLAGYRCRRHKFDVLCTLK